jgi:hypothetical protein
MVQYTELYQNKSAALRLQHQWADTGKAEFTEQLLVYTQFKFNQNRMDLIRNITKKMKEFSSLYFGTTDVLSAYLQN